MRYVYQLKEWPRFRWNHAELEGMLSKSTLALGKFLGRLSSLGFDVQSQAVCETIASEIVNSAAIEGEALNRDSVRHSFQGGILAALRPCRCDVTCTPLSMETRAVT